MKRPERISGAMSWIGLTGTRGFPGYAARGVALWLVLSMLVGGLWLQPTIAAPDLRPVIAPTVILGPAAVSTPTPTATTAIEPSLDAGPATSSTSGLSQIIWSPDGTVLAVATNSGVFLYDSASFARIRFIASDAAVTSLAYSPDGAVLGAGTIGGAVQCWRASDGESLLTIQEQAGPVNSVVFAADNTTLAAGYWDGAVRLWSITDGALLAALQGQAGRVWSVALNGDSSLLAAGSGDGTVHLWQVTTRKQLRVIEVGSGEVSSVAFSPDNSLLAAGAGDGTVHVFRTRDGASLRKLQGHQSSVSGVAFSPDGNLLASSSLDGSARLWRPRDGAAIRTLPAQTGPLASIAFSPDGDTLGAGSIDGRVKLWALQGVGGEAPAPEEPVVESTETVPPIATVAPEATCQDNAVYVGDVTVPDNTVFNPGEHFDKTWRIRNAGTCTWGAGYHLAFVSGNIMGAQNSVGVVLTDPNGSTDVSVPMVAPATPGTYSGMWQMVNANGQPFGQKYTVVIQVPPPPPPQAPTPTDTATVPPPPPTPQPQPAGPAKVEISADQTSIQSGKCTTLRANVENVKAAWLDGDPVVGGYGEKKVCPCPSKTYFLEADLNDGNHLKHSVTVHVNGLCQFVMPPLTLVVPNPLLHVTLIPIFPTP